VALGRRLALREPGDTRRALTIAAVTGALYAIRDDIRHEVDERRSPSRTRLYDDARTLSKGWVSPLIAGSLLLAGKVGRNPRNVETAQIMLESTAYSAAVASSGSFILAAERPEDGSSVDVFRTSGRGVSLDVALAASVVAPLDRRHLRWRDTDGGWVRAAKATGRGLLYGALGLTAMQRLDADKHWAPDVFLGAAAGLSVGYSICSAHEGAAPPARGPAPARRRASVNLQPNGIGLRWEF
jgi:hypothetical protein